MGHKRTHALQQIAESPSQQVKRILRIAALDALQEKYGGAPDDVHAGNPE
jgi:hypothetical protein